MTTDPSTWLQLRRTVRFGDTDGAGVMHFHQLLRWCHEAYEESLERFGIAANDIFPTPAWHSTQKTRTDSTHVIALPIIHCSADYLHPLVCGDQLIILLRPQLVDIDSFEISYLLHNAGRHTSSDIDVARAITCHRAINAASRKRCELPLLINRWLTASENVSKKKAIA